MAMATWLLLALLNVVVAMAPPLSLAAGAPNRQPAAIDSPSGDRAWAKSCLIHSRCRRIARRLPRCPVGTKALTVEDVQVLPGDGRVVSVRGPLSYDDFAASAVACTAFNP